MKPGGLNPVPTSFHEPGEQRNCLLNRTRPPRKILRQGAPTSVWFSKKPARTGIKNPGIHPHRNGKIPDSPHSPAWNYCRSLCKGQPGERCGFPFWSTTNASTSGRFFIKESPFSTPKTKRAVESASLATAVGATTLMLCTDSAGSPVLGSMMWQIRRLPS